MSWYAPIYVYVRKVRQRRPILGYFLHLALNILLILQLIGAGFSYYVYTYVICVKMLTSKVQMCIYLAVYNTLCFMMFWSLFQTIRTPIARVPDHYKANENLDKQMKDASPCEKGRYLPDKSNEVQLETQNRLLNELVQKTQVNVVEVDHWDRYRYCYQCNHLKPDRCHHCSSCGFCVLKFDHHCPWINKCINHANYKFFLLYILYGCSVVAWSILTSIEPFIRYFVKQHWIGELDEVIQMGICMLMHAVFGYYPMGELLIYHFKLLSTNETTCEQAKLPIIAVDKQANYNLGRYYNFRSVFGWGLWLFPVNTTITDGTHFPVHYTEACKPSDKLFVRKVTECTLATRSTNIPGNRSQGVFN